MYYFNPGCALVLYKPHLAETILRVLNQQFNTVQWHDVCCHHDPMLPHGSTIINVCAGCDRRFRSLYEGIDTLSLWEVLDSLPTYTFPDHSGLTVSIHDACPVRERPAVHKAVRSLLSKMNISIVETAHHSTHSICCGDDLYPKAPLDVVRAHMQRRAQSMPCEDVCVYCVSCIKSMTIGGKTPRYLVDLLFNEDTFPGECDTVKWHDSLDVYREQH
jgi:Fe-S oxidoreductase